MRKVVHYFDFECVMAGRERSEWQTAIQSDLLAFAGNGTGIFRGTPDLLFVAEKTIYCRHAGLAKHFIGFQVVKLQEDSEIFGAGKRVREARANFVRTKNELARANLRRWNGFDYVGKDQCAGVENFGRQ